MKKDFPILVFLQIKFFQNCHINYAHIIEFISQTVELDYLIES